jgi:DNA-binding transcriptional MerR regulator
MDTKAEKFNLSALSNLTGLAIRTIRYYIQIGLIDKPTGAGRGAHYTTVHVDQLLEIKKWQDAGLSLSRIQELLEGRSGDPLVPPAPKPEPGAVSVWSHVFVRDGVQLQINPSEAGLSPEQVRQLTADVMKAIGRIEKKDQGK